jgi:uncharacterized protein (TIGR02597 family)
MQVVFMKETTNMKKLNLSLAFLALAAMSVNAQTTVNSGIVGYTTINVRAKTGAANALSFVSLNVHRPSVFVGSVASKSLDGTSRSIITSLGASLVNNALIATGSKCYVRITSGSNAGQISEVVSNTATTITVAQNWDSFLDVGTTYEVRPYWTLATAFPAGGGLAGGTSGTTADNVTVINPSTGVGDVFFYSSSASQWRKGVTDNSNYYILPGSGILISRKSGTPVNIVMVGEVLMGPVQQNVLAGSSTAQKTTFVANPYPLASKTLATSGLYTGVASTGLVGGTSGTTADNLIIYDPVTGVASSYFYNTSVSQWRKGVTDSSNVTIPDGSAVLVTRKANRPTFDWYIPQPNIAN